MSETINKYKGKEQAVLYAGLLVLAIGLVIFLREAALGLNLFEFADETEKFVAAQMIEQGQRLYRDIFAHHGPVAYMIAHLYTILVSRNDFTHLRIFLAFLALLSSVALYCSPVFKTTVARVWSVAAYLLLLSSVWILQGMHMLLYQQIGGFLLTITVFHVFAPLFYEVQLKRSGVVASGVAVVVSCFSAYAFGPSAVMLVVASTILLFATGESGEWRKVVFPFITGILLGLSAILLWMLLFADVKGFYIYHFFFNQHIYTQYIRFSPTSIFNNFTVSFAHDAVVHTIALTLSGVWAVFFLVSSLRTSPARIITAKLLALFIFIGSVGYLNPRGEAGFQDNAFIIVNFAVFVLVAGIALGRYAEKSSLGKTTCTSGLILLIVLLIGQGTRHALSSPHRINRNEWSNHLFLIKPEEGGVYEFVRSLTNKEGGLLCLIFNPIHYIKADRLPASGHYYYLPWQATYNRKPVAEYKIDICSDIQSHNPGVIWFDNWKVRGFIPLEKYGACILSIMKKNYIRLSSKSQLYVRKDLLVEEMGADRDESVTIQLSSTLSASSPIQIRMTPGHQSQSTGLRRIGVMFATPAGENQGEAELRLQGPDGAEFAQRFALPDLGDNTYRYFDLDAKHYTAGEIISRAGGGIRTWEGRNEQGDIATCITYEYANGQRGFTPGCPLY